MAVNSGVPVSEPIKRIAKITGTMLGFEDHGILTVMLYCRFGDYQQGVGGLAMSTCSSADDKPVAIPAFGDFVIGVLTTCGVQTWEQLVGRTIYVLYASDDAGLNAWPVGIENLPTEPGASFLFAEWAKTLKKES
jgi:hypothetical protein